MLSTAGSRLVGFGSKVTVTSSVLVPMTRFEADGANEIGTPDNVIGGAPGLSV